MTEVGSESTQSASSCLLHQHVHAPAPIFDSPRPEPWHDMTQVDKRELFAHHDIHFETAIWMFMRGLAAVYWLAWFQTVLLFAKSWFHIAKFLTHQGQNHGMT
jgi:hypothetical protein